MILVSIVAGAVYGKDRAKFKNKPGIAIGQVTRHVGGAFFKHWGTALGIFTLIVSGILLGFLFFPHLMDTPETAAFPLNMHFVGLMITSFGGFYFITDYLLSRNFMLLVPNLKDIIHGTLGKYFLRKKWVTETKYLSAQKSSFLLFALVGGVQLVTGAIKMVAHIWLLSPSVMSITTVIHDIFSLLFIILLIIHVLFVIAIPRHWPLLKSWFKGKVTEEYAKKEHPIWYKELKKDI